MTKYDGEEGIKTATIYVTDAELKAFKDLAKHEQRREAAQLVALARAAAESQDEFIVIQRPAGGKPSYQIKTVAANPYLLQIAERIAGASLSDIVESLIRRLSK